MVLISFQMSSNLSLWSLLDNKKLKGPNFDSWYQKLRIILEHEQILYVITDLALEIPPTDARSLVRDAYLKWISDQTSVRCIMLATMNDEFSHKFEEAQLDEILQKLKESFGMPNDVERYKVSYAIYNAKMPNGGSVTDHVLYMIEIIEWLGKLGCPLHEQLDKDAILNSLSSSYLDFLDHYKMNKPTVNYHNLMGLL